MTCQQHKKTHILMLFDLPFAPPQDYAHQFFYKLLKHNPDYKDEKDVFNTLRRHKYQVSLWGIYDDIAPLVKRLQQGDIDLVFCLCETYNNDRDQVANIVSLLEIMGIPYTGVNSSSLKLCSDKATSKLILQKHGVRTPRFVIVRQGKELNNRESLNFPVIVKPLNLEASEGISFRSVARSYTDAQKRVSFIHEKYHCDAIVEEYIEGRELYVAVLGNKHIKIGYPQEINFKKMPAHLPKIASFTAKWDQAFRKKYQIDSHKARCLSPRVTQKIRKLCKIAHKTLHLQGYARIDVRLSDDGEVYFLEANPNPAISRIDDFAESARHVGIRYSDLIRKIVELGLKAS